MNRLERLKQKLQVQWPDNEIINFVFLGDSKTAGYRQSPQVVMHNSYPARFIEWINATYPTAVVNLINAGVGGWGVAEGIHTLEDYVIRHKPDFVTICYGMNDFLKGLEYLPEFRNIYSTIIAKLQSEGIEHIMLLTSIPFLEETQEGRKILSDFGIRDCKHVQDEFMEEIVRIGKEHNLPVAHIYKYWLDNMTPYGDKVALYSNGINHPNNEGHRIIAESLIAAFASE